MLCSADGNMLTANMVASSFGKLVMKERPREGVRQEDLALALLMMITNNIGQIAHLIAQLHQCNKIFFVGSFLRHNPISCKRLAFAIDFWSGGTMEALFLAHEGYFGAIGTFLQSAFGEDVDKILNESSQKSNPPSQNERDATSTTGEETPPGSSKGWRQNIRKIAEWSASHFSDTPPQPSHEGRRARSSSDDYHLKRRAHSSK